MNKKYVRLFVALFFSFLVLFSSSFVVPVSAANSNFTLYASMTDGFTGYGVDISYSGTYYASNDAGTGNTSVRYCSNETEVFNGTLTGSGDGTLAFANQHDYLAMFTSLSGGRQKILDVSTGLYLMERSHSLNTAGKGESALWSYDDSFVLARLGALSGTSTFVVYNWNATASEYLPDGVNLSVPSNMQGWAIPSNSNMSKLVYFNNSDATYRVRLHNLTYNPSVNGYEIDSGCYRLTINSGLYYSTCGYFNLGFLWYRNYGYLFTARLYGGYHQLIVSLITNTSITYLQALNLQSDTSMGESYLEVYPDGTLFIQYKDSGGTRYGNKVFLNTGGYWSLYGENLTVCDESPAYRTIGGSAYGATNYFILRNATYDFHVYTLVSGSVSEYIFDFVCAYNVTTPMISDNMFYIGVIVHPISRLVWRIVNPSGLIVDEGVTRFSSVAHSISSFISSRFGNGTYTFYAMPYSLYVYYANTFVYSLCGSYEFNVTSAYVSDYGVYVDSDLYYTNVPITYYWKAPVASHVFVCLYEGLVPSNDSLVYNSSWMIGNGSFKPRVNAFSLSDFGWYSLRLYNDSGFVPGASASFQVFDSTMPSVFCSVDSCEAGAYVALYGYSYNVDHELAVYVNGNLLETLDIVYSVGAYFSVNYRCSDLGSYAVYFYQNGHVVFPSIYDSWTCEEASEGYSYLDSPYSAYVGLMVCLVVGAFAAFISLNGTAFIGGFVGSMAVFSIPDSPFTLFPVSVLALTGFILLLVFMYMLFRR